MRDIIFRAKRTANGAWVYGDLTHVQKICTEEEQRNGRRSEPVARVANYNVDEETIGQYTGVRDANENMIFEGDILGTDVEGINCTYPIVFSGGAFCLCSGIDITMPLKHLRIGDFTIVGNVYDKK